MTAPGHDYLNHFANELFPGFGYFGQRRGLWLEIQVTEAFDRIEILFDDDELHDYVFPGLTFIGQNGFEKLLSEFDFVYQISPQDVQLSDEQVNACLKAGRAFRTMPRVRPAITLRFDSEVVVSKVVFSNGKRPQSLRVRNFVARFYRGHSVVSEFVNADNKRLLGEYLDIHKVLGMDLPQVGGDIEYHNQIVRDRFIRFLESGMNEWSGFRLAQLLPLFAEETSLTAYNLRILAETIIALRDRRGWLATPTCVPFEALMSTEAKIESVIAEVNRILSHRLGREVNYVAAKHWIQEPVLVLHRDRHLACLDKVFPAFEACGVKAMLCYGALLGAIREGGFLTHDDDIDLIYLDGSTSREEMMARRADLIKGLAAQGFVGNDRKEKINFHIKDKNATLDVFPTWREGDQLYIMMAYPRYKAIPISAFLPVGTIDLYGHSYPAPANPVAVLEARYGSTWQTSDPYFEWPWPLEGRKQGRITGFADRSVKVNRNSRLLKLLPRPVARWLSQVYRRLKGS